MPNVLTYNEYTDMVDIIRPLAVRSVKSYLEKIDLGQEFDLEDLNRVRFITYLRNIIVQDWQQADFTSEAYSNYFSGSDIRSLYAKFLKLTECDVDYNEDILKPKIEQPIFFSPPIITVQPVDKSVVLAATLTIPVTATTGSTFQWYKDSILINGATSATYTKANFALTDVGEYFVIVTKNGKNTYSKVVKVTKS